MQRILDHTPPRLPADQPRYLMGVGTPEDLVEGVAARHRHVRLRDADPQRAQRPLLHPLRRRADPQRALQARHAPIDGPAPALPARSFSRAYLRHLDRCNEMLAPMLATVHNLHYYVDLMREVRAAIEARGFAAFAAPFGRTAGAAFEGRAGASRRTRLTRAAARRQPAGRSPPVAAARGRPSLVSAADGSVSDDGRRAHPHQEIAMTRVADIMTRSIATVQPRRTLSGRREAHGRDGHRRAARARRPGGRRHGHRPRHHRARRRRGMIPQESKIAEVMTEDVRCCRPTIPSRASWPRWATPRCGACRSSTATTKSSASSPSPTSPRDNQRTPTKLCARSRRPSLIRKPPNALQRYLGERLIGPAAQHVLRHPGRSSGRRSRGFAPTRGCCSPARSRTTRCCRSCRC